MFNDYIWSVHPDSFNNYMANLKFLLEQKEFAAALVEARQPQEITRRIDNVAVIPIRGMINQYFGFGVSATSTLAIENAVRAATEDNKIDAIVLHIDSPGGSVFGLSQAADAIAEASSKKYVVAQVDGMAASAAYYLASQANRINAERGSMVGSIGTRAVLYDASRMVANLGVKVIPVDTGEYKSAGLMGTEVTERQIADTQRVVDAYFQDFLSAVSNGRRNMSSQELKDVADGRMFMANESQQLKLIDNIGTLAKTMASIRPMRGFSAATARAQYDLTTA
jgi:signal peptide peptidase SppA